jgi:RimJ/RimL family protein N-acetyltransferase
VTEAAPLRLGPLDAGRDGAAVAAVVDAAIDYFELETGDTDVAAIAARFFAERPPGDGPPPMKLGVFRGDDLVGLADLSFGFPEADVAYIGLLALVPSARGAGLGGRAFAELAARAGARGARRLMLGVLEANPAARRFWERLGFRLVLTRDGVAFGKRIHTVHRLERDLPVADAG